MQINTQHGDSIYNGCACCKLVDFLQDKHVAMRHQPQNCKQNWRRGNVMGISVALFATMNQYVYEMCYRNTFCARRKGPRGVPLTKR